MKLILISFVCVIMTSAYSQDIIVSKKYTSGIDIDTLTGIKNKKVVFKYDTVFLINETGVSELLRCADDLIRIKSLNSNLSDLSGTIYNIENDVKLVYSNTDYIVDFINLYKNDTEIKLDSITADNYRLKNNMDLISKELDEACDKIRAERWNSYGTKVLYGTGGFILGSLLILLVSN